MSLSNWSFNGTSIENIQPFEYFESSRESGQATLSVNASEMTRVFYVRWDQRLQFVSDLLGYSTLAFNDDVYSISRVLPEPLVANPLFYAYDANIQPVGQGVVDDESQNDGAWTLAKVTAKYKPVPYNVLPDNQVSTEMERFVSRTYQVQTEFISIQGSMAFVTGGRQLGRSPGRYISKGIKQMTWHGVPSKPDNPYSPPNYANWIECSGKLNLTWFDVSADNHPPGTCLFVGQEAKLIMPRLDQENLMWDITMNFQIFDEGTDDTYTADPDEPDNHIGHNWVLNQATGDFDIITSNANRLTGTRCYRLADLNTLFEVA